MTITLELNPAEASRLTDTAQVEGKSVESVIHELIAGLAARPSANGASRPAPRTDAELFAQWEAEDAAMTDEEIAAENADWEQMKANMNACRAENGERLLFP